jgi:hypothetical protein
MVRLGKHFASVALLVVAVAAPAVTQSSANAAAPSAAAKGQTQAVPASQTSAASPQTRTRRKKKAEPLAQAPQNPPPPASLDQQPPTAPQVSYRDGLLSINAPNSTLSAVLRAVQNQTGATMDVPASANNDRIAMAIGPGQPRDVVNTLLNGSTFDYMILGVAGRPGAIQRVILTPKTAAGATNQAANTPPPNAEEPVDDSNVADTGGESEYPGPAEQQQQQPVPPGAFRRPMGAPGGQAYQQEQQDQQQNPFPPGESDNVVKTPEQLMQELQQMQQQQQQYQEQLNPANQNPPQ